MGTNLERRGSLERRSRGRGGGQTVVELAALRGEGEDVGGFGDGESRRFSFVGGVVDDGVVSRCCPCDNVELGDRRYGDRSGGG
jgi:hypothetical protein